jgi:hypothetical protein
MTINVASATPGGTLVQVWSSDNNNVEIDGNYRGSAAANFSGAAYNVMGTSQTFPIQISSMVASGSNSSTETVKLTAQTTVGSTTTGPVVSGTFNIVALPPASPVSIVFDSPDVNQGQTAMATLTLNSPAGSNGVVVPLGGTGALTDSTTWGGAFPTFTLQLQAISGGGSGNQGFSPVFLGAWPMIGAALPGAGWSSVTVPAGATSVRFPVYPSGAENGSAVQTLGPGLPTATNYGSVANADFQACVWVKPVSLIPGGTPPAPSVQGCVNAHYRQVPTASYTLSQQNPSPYALPGDNIPVAVSLMSNPVPRGCMGVSSPIPGCGPSAWVATAPAGGELVTLQVVPTSCPGGGYGSPNVSLQYFPTTNIGAGGTGYSGSVINVAPNSPAGCFNLDVVTTFGTNEYLIFVGPP